MARSDLYSRLYGATQVELAKTLEAGELEVVRQYGAVLLECRKKLERIYGKYAVDGKLDNAAMSQANRLTQLQDDIEAILRDKVPSVSGYVKKLTGDLYQESFYRHAYAIDQAGGMSLSWGLVPEQAVENAVKGTYGMFAKSRIVSMAQKDAIAAIRKDLGLAVTRGDSYAVLAKRLANHIGVDVKMAKAVYGHRGMAAWSVTVARTEGQRVLVEGQAAAYDKARDLGCDIEAIWDATLDSRTRPSHGALDGKARDEAKGGWVVPGIGVVSAPLHSGVAAFDVNCRCRVRSQVRGYPPQERYVRGNGVQAYVTYEEWKKGL